MQLAIMQPYFFPYIGYFQLINAVDEFVVYDNIEFTKKGWINRNRVLVNGQDAYITLPLKKDSDYLDIKERWLSDNWVMERKKMLNRITESYRKAPFFAEVYPVIEKAVLFDDHNLFNFIFHSLNLVNTYLGINTRMLIASGIEMDHELKADKKVIAICRARKANIYINPIGGMELYSKDNFKQEGIRLQFLQSKLNSYQQFTNDFVPWLSIIDVMMFTTKEMIRDYLRDGYALV